MASGSMARQLLASPVPVIATVALKGPGFIAQVKGRGDVQLIQVTEQSRDELPVQLARCLRSCLPSC